MSIIYSGAHEVTGWTGSVSQAVSQHYQVVTYPMFSEPRSTLLRYATPTQSFFSFILPSHQTTTSSIMSSSFTLWQQRAGGVYSHWPTRVARVDGRLPPPAQHQTRS